MSCNPLALLSLGLAAALSACSPPGQEAAGRPLGMYRDLGERGSVVDQQSALEIISSYRRNNGLGGLTLDPELSRLAAEETRAMVAAGKPSSADALKGRVVAAGFRSPAVNISAGDHTIAEAFSGWRESPPHKAAMLDRTGDRMGIATAPMPGGKYQVFWALIIARK